MKSVVDKSARSERQFSLNAFQWLLLFVAGLMILIVGIHLEEGFRGVAAWRRYEAEAKRHGVKLTLADYIPPPVPDDENFASIPIFEAAFRAAEEKKTAPDPFEIRDWWSPRSASLSDSIKQKRLDLGEWQAEFVKVKLIPTAGHDATADVLKALDHFAEPLAQLHTAGLRLRCRFPVHWEQGPYATSPHFSVLMGAGRLNALRLGAHLAQGDSAAAYEDFHDGLRLCTATSAEPTAIAGLVRMSIAAMMENAVWDGLAGHQWKELELRKIEADLATLDWLKDYLFSINCFRADFNANADMALAQPQKLAILTSPYRVYGTQRAVQRVCSLLYPAGWIYQSKVRMNRYCDEMCVRIDLGQRRWHSELTVPSSRRNLSGGPEAIYHLAFWLLGADLEIFEQRYLYIATNTDEARLACALERYRLTHGSYPATLAELAPEFISSVPVEIVNGQPYHYRLTDDDSFILYSVGMDLRDDGGVLNPAANASRQIDWVWRYPRLP